MWIMMRSSFFQFEILEVAKSDFERDCSLSRDLLHQLADVLVKEKVAEAASAAAKITKRVDEKVIHHTMS
jgi:hypothetical protein